MVQIFINDVEYTQSIRQSTFQISDRLSDPVSLVQFDLEDTAQAFAFGAYQPVVVLEDSQPTSPTHNIYVDPLYTTQTNLSQDSGHETITYDTTAGSATFVVSAHSTPIASFSQTQTVRANPSQTYTFSLYRNISSIATCTVFITTTVYNADGSTASTATDTFSTTSGGTVRYSKTVALSSTARFLAVTYGVQSIISTSTCTAVFSHPQLEMQRAKQQISYPTPDCVPGAANCTQLPDLTTVREARRFAGYLTIIAWVYEGRNRLWSLQASGGAIMLSKRVISYTFPSQGDTTTVLALINSNMAGLLTATATSVIGTGSVIQVLGGFSITLSGTTLPAMSGQNVYVKDVLDSIIQQTGAIYWIDAYSLFHYQMPGSSAAAFSLSDTPDNVTSFPYYLYQNQQDATQLANRVNALSQTSTITGNYIGSGNGSRTIFTVSSVPMQSIIEISVNGSIYTTSQYSANLPGGTVTFNSPPANAAIIHVGYTFDEALQTIATNGGSVATIGLTLDGRTQGSSLNAASEVTQYALVELEALGMPQTVITLSCNHLPQVGQRLALTNAADGYAGKTFLVQQVQTAILGTNEAGVQVCEYQVTLGDYQPDLVQQLSYFQRQQANSQVTSAAVISSLYEVALEPVVNLTESVSARVTTTPFLQGRDTFAGRTSGGFSGNDWGTASDGQTWVPTTVGSPAYSVSGGEGQVTTGGSAASAEFVLGSHTGQNVDMRVRFAIALFGASGGTQASVAALLRDVNANNRYRATLTGTQGSGGSLLLQKTVSGSTSTAGSASSIAGFTMDQTYWWLHVRASGTSFSLSTWKDGTMEPTSPQVTLTDSGITGAGQFGLSFTLPSGIFSAACYVDSLVVLGI